MALYKNSAFAMKVSMGLDANLSLKLFTINVYTVKVVAVETFLLMEAISISLIKIKAL